MKMGGTCAGPTADGFPLRPNRPGGPGGLPRAFPRRQCRKAARGEAPRARLFNASHRRASHRLLDALMADRDAAIRHGAHVKAQMARCHVNARPAMMPAASTLSRLNRHEDNAARSS
jgi:hypothetical protein